MKSRWQAAIFRRLKRLSQFVDGFEFVRPGNDTGNRPVREFGVENKSYKL